MFLKKIALFNFKNYEDSVFEFSERINFIVGKNGTGKTNILEAIYFSCITKSFSGLSDAQLIRHGEQIFVVKSIIDELEIVASTKDGHKKTFLVDKIPYQKVTDHLGKFPIIYVSPNDHDYIRDASDSRRKLLDELFCQLDSKYLNHLIEYNKLLKQRNQLLKQFKERNYFDQELLDTYSEKLCPHNLYISKFRNEMLLKINQITSDFYQTLSNEREKVGIELESDLSNTSEEFLQKMRDLSEKDRILLRTNYGCHKDDYSFKINELPLKKYGSQGQQKSFMLSLQLAKYKVLQEYNAKIPFLLLDDVFDKLDSDRIERMLKIISSSDFGQVFITDASPERTEGFSNLLSSIFSTIKID